ncbi:MAG: saccharopine dehydrogenase NADP-binding domain-containing protein [Candidatus Woesearchaeota archaeon]
MKIFIVGMGGVSSVMSKLLAHDSHVSEIKIASNNIKRDRQFIAPHNKIHLVTADAANTNQIAKLAKGYDLIINACCNFFNDSLMQAALKANANYQDLALMHNPPEQLKYDKAFRKQGLVGLFCTGIAPGITNLLVKDVADRLDSVDSVKFYSFEDQQAAVLVSAWSKEAAFDTLTDNPPIYGNGKYLYKKTFDDPEEYCYPAPYCSRFAFLLYGDEVCTIPRYIKLKHCSFKASGTDIDTANTFFRCGLFSEKPVSVNGKKIVPLDFFSKIIPPVPTPKEMLSLMKKGLVENGVYLCVMEIVGKDSGKPIKVKVVAKFPDLKFISKKFPGATYISYPTGLAAAAFAGIIPKVKEPGVIPPEALAANLRKQLLATLENECCVIDQEFSKP